MRTHLLFATAIRALMHHKGRSLLTSLGIIMGIAAIIATLAIGQGTEKKLREEILSFGENYLFISPHNPGNDGLQRKLRKPVRNLSHDDVTALQATCPSIKKISPVMFDRGLIEYHTNKVQAEIKSGNQDLLAVVNRPLAYGRSFSELENRHCSRVAVIAHNVAALLGDKETILHKTIVIKKIPFVVIGIIKKLPIPSGFNDPNNAVFIPIATAKKYLYRTTSPTIHGIAIGATHLHDIPTLAQQITNTMRLRHNLHTADADDFKLFDQYAMLKSAEQSSTTFNLFLLFIALLTLLIGGIGVMNIMLVSITERQQEIGIRIALGATRSMVLLQFLYEACMLCLFGGIFGIITGISIVHIAEQYGKFPAIITIQSLYASALSIISVGLLFGFYPAYKAAHIEPIQALRK